MNPDCLGSFEEAGCVSSASCDWKRGIRRGLLGRVRLQPYASRNEGSREESACGTTASGMSLSQIVDLLAEEGGMKNLGWLFWEWR